MTTGGTIVSLAKVVAGVVTVLGTYPWPFATRPSVAVAISALGTSIWATVDGVDQPAVVDADLAAAGAFAISAPAAIDIGPTIGYTIGGLRAFSRVP